MRKSSRAQLPPPRVYQLRLPPWLGLLLLIPVGLFVVSVAAAIVIAGFAAALILPFFLRRALRPPQRHRDKDTIELRPEDYRRIE